MIKVTIGSYTVFLGEDLIHVLFSFRQVKTKSPESGGILLGQMKAGVIYLLRASIPNAKDNSHRTGFTRNKEVAQIIINHEFFNSGKKTIYLGEWHTHPEDNPSPSFQDFKMFEEQFKKNNLNEDFIITIIVGYTYIFVGVLDKNAFQDVTVPWSELLDTN